MKNILLATALSAMSFVSFANDGDLVLPGERWISTFNGYICAAFQPTVEAPAVHSELNVKFETLTSDYSLDNGLIKATFEVDGEVCRYSAIMFADNDAATIDLVESKAYSLGENADCSAGKALLDQHLTANDYLYYGHPHNLAVMIPVEGAADVCGEGATHMGVNFVVTGRINN